MSVIKHPEWVDYRCPECKTSASEFLDSVLLVSEDLAEEMLNWSEGERSTICACGTEPERVTGWVTVKCDGCGYEPAHTDLDPCDIWANDDPWTHTDKGDFCEDCSTEVVTE